MPSIDSSAASRKKKFRFEFRPEHMPPPISPGKWHVEWDGVNEFMIVDENGDEVGSFDRHTCEFGQPGDDRFKSNLQCITLVPELIRAVYVAMRALCGDIPDNESADSISQKLSDLVRDCYSTPVPRAP